MQFYLPKYKIPKIDNENDILSLSPISCYDEIISPPPKYKTPEKKEEDVLSIKPIRYVNLNGLSREDSPDFEINLENIDLMHEIHVEKKDKYGTSFDTYRTCNKIRNRCQSYIKTGYDCQMIRFDGKKSFIISPKKENDDRYPKGKCFCNYACKCNSKRYICC